MAMGGMGVRAQGMDGRKKSAGITGRYLLVGGGGSTDGGTAAGGGGAGEMLEGTTRVPSGVFQVVIGLARPSSSGLKGADAVALGLTARGGGFGPGDGVGNTGGSASGNGAFNAGYGTRVQGTGQNTNAGGASVQSFGVYASGGGGGGAASAGTDGTPSFGGNGGNGKTSDITGTSQYYAAGGRGGIIFSSAGSNGLGWAANNGSGADAISATSGGTGVFIWSYASPTQLCTGGTVTDYTSGGVRYWVHTFTTSGTLVVP